MFEFRMRRIVRKAKEKRLMYRAFLVFFALTQSCLMGQGTGTATGDGESSPNAVVVTIAADPGTDLPVGVEVKLTETHVPDSLANERLSWAFCPCVGKIPLDCENREGWNTKTIKCCNGSANTSRFKFAVAHDSQDYETPGKKEIDIKWNPPDRMKFEYSPPQKVVTPAVPEIPAGQPHGPQVAIPAGVLWVQKVKVTLFYGDKPIGPCALVCAKEVVRREPLHVCAERLPDDGKTKKTTENPEGASVFPEDCAGYHTEKTIRGIGIPFIPGVPDSTFDWQSPCLTDTHLVWGPLANFGLPFGDLPDGTKIYKIRRQYVLGATG
jgi:hypothetical protein